MKIKLISTLLALLMLISVFSGCAGKAEDTTTIPATDIETAAADTLTDEADTKGAVTTEEPTTEEPTTDALTDTEPEQTDPETTVTETETTAKPDTEPETTVKETEPETTVPATQPVTTSPETTVPVTTVPETTAPVTTVPVTEAETTTLPSETTTSPEETTAPDTGTEIPDPEPPAIVKMLPSDSSVMSAELAKKLLSVCTGGNEASNSSLLINEGFSILFSKHYNKQKSDRSHNSAFTVGKLSFVGKNYYAVTIRGTSGGEWYSNFDFAPSHSNDTQYAENFMLAAQDVYLSIKSLLDADKNAVVIISGHSRGAATANLLGVLLDEAYDPANIYVYTYATPNTVRGEAAKKEYKNIFNFINDNDVVTRMPLKDHGFSRAGTDIMLPTTPSGNALLNRINTLSKIAPTISSYYTDKHALDRAGLSDDGMTG